MTAAPQTTDTAVRIAESIRALPPLPATAHEILNCFGDEFIDAEKVAVVVEGDPGICAKLLGLANSAYFGLAQPVHDIGEVISRVLGVDTVRSLVLAMAIQQSFDNKSCPAFDTERFWMRSLLAAECCKQIAVIDELAGDTARDLAYTTGLCHNLGLMALTFIEPARTNHVLRLHRDANGDASLAELFDAEFETDHKIVTAELGRLWSLPLPMVAAYQFRAFPDAHCDERLGLIAAAGVAAVRNTELDPDRRSSLLLWADSLGIEAEALQSMAVFGDRQRETVRSLASNLTRY